MALDFKYSQVTSPTVSDASQLEGNPGVILGISADGKTPITYSSSVLGLVSQGLTGPQGIQGIQGIKGKDGSGGGSGGIGPQGAVGAQGTQGARGVQGTQGYRGSQGTTGANGKDGTGVTVKGSKAECTKVGDCYIDEDGNLQVLQSGSGTSGVYKNVGKIEGPQGAKGDKGDDGDRGIQGIQGTQGLTGIQGIKGTDGTDGEGIQGSRGLQGQRGLQGLSGQEIDWATIVRLFNSNGFTLNNGYLAAAGAQGIIKASNGFYQE